MSRAMRRIISGLGGRRSGVLGSGLSLSLTSNASSKLSLTLIPIPGITSPEK